MKLIAFKRKGRVEKLAERDEDQTHKTAFELHTKDSGIKLRDQTTKIEVLLPKSQQCIVHAISDINMKDIQYTKNKFETACFLAIEELPLTKHLKCCNLRNAELLLEIRTKIQSQEEFSLIILQKV